MEDFGNGKQTATLLRFPVLYSFRMSKAVHSGLFSIDNNPVLSYDANELREANLLAEKSDFKKESIDYQDFKKVLRIAAFNRKTNTRKIKEFIRAFKRKNEKKPSMADMINYQNTLSLPHFDSHDLYFMREGKEKPSELKTIEEHKALKRNAVED